MTNPCLRTGFDPAEVGAALAHATDEEQAVAVNAFFSELIRVCRGRFRAQTQISYVRDRLNQDAKDVLEVPDKVP